jgi:hypothetical protein
VNKTVLKAMAKTQQGYGYNPYGRARVLILAASVLWWLPLVVGR